ncbi:MAG: thiamine phosphate synthase [Thermodesulfobacteriota bacterium]
MKVDFDIYLVTDRKQTCGKSLEEVIKSSLAGGIKAVQLREKDLDDRELFTIAKRLKTLTHRFGAKLFINDRLDIALAVDADGLHLGQESISPNDARKHFGENKLIGVSAHSLDEALRAENDGADFITIGPIYDTPSKRRYGKPIGLNELERVTGKLRIPTFAIGGMRKEKVRDIIHAGAHGIALISAVLKTKNPEKAAKEIVEEMRCRKGK